MEREIKTLERSIYLLRLQRQEIIKEIEELRVRRSRLLESLQKTLNVYDRLETIIDEMNREINMWEMETFPLSQRTRLQGGGHDIEEVTWYRIGTNKKVIDNMWHTRSWKTISWREIETETEINNPVAVIFSVTRGWKNFRHGQGKRYYYRAKWNILARPLICWPFFMFLFPFLESEMENVTLCYLLGNYFTPCSTRRVRQDNTISRNFPSMATRYLVFPQSYYSLWIVEMSNH